MAAGSVDVPTTITTGGATPQPHDGGAAALDELVPAVYSELREIAHRHLARMRRAGAKDATLVTTALVNEAYLKLAVQTDAHWNDRAHFLALAARAMRHVMIDQAKAGSALKRGAGRANVTFDDGVQAGAQSSERLLEIDDAIERLSTMHPRLAQVIECRFYGGLSEDDTALALGVTVRTVQRDWVKARAVLRRLLDE